MKKSILTSWTIFCVLLFFLENNEQMKNLEIYFLYTVIRAINFVLYIFTLSTKLYELYSKNHKTTSFGIFQSLWGTGILWIITIKLNTNYFLVVLNKIGGGKTLKKLMFFFLWIRTTLIYLSYYVNKSKKQYIFLHSIQKSCLDTFID